MRNFVSSMKALKQYGQDTICYTWCPKNLEFETLAICKANNLCELDGGRELYRSANPRVQFDKLTMHGQPIKPLIVYYDDDCAAIAKSLAKKYGAALIHILNSTL